MAKLNQILAIEKGVKSETYAEVSKLHTTSQKPELYEGMTKTFAASDADGEKLPDESKRVQLISGDVFRALSLRMTELFDVEARKDFTNTVALADVVVGDVTIVRDAPVTYLLFLEKQITDLHTFVAKIPTLDPAYDWKADANSGLFRTEVQQSHRTKKVPKVLVKYEATDKHPAQTEVITEDVITGYWSTTRLSGAMQAPEKRAFLQRIDALMKAVKFAREQANMTEEVKIDSAGKAVFDYLLPVVV